MAQSQRSTSKFCFIVALSRGVLILMDLVFQIKNVVRAAHALAAQDAAQVTYSDLATVIDLGKEYESDIRGGRATNDLSYL